MSSVGNWNIAFYYPPWDVFEPNRGTYGLEYIFLYSPNPFISEIVQDRAIWAEFLTWMRNAKVYACFFKKNYSTGSLSAMLNFYAEQKNTFIIHEVRQSNFGQTLALNGVW